MKDETRVAIIKKEAETYRKLADLLKFLTPVLLSFNGKCYNKKIAEKLNEAANPNSEKRECCVNVAISGRPCELFLDVRIHVYDNFVSEQTDNGLTNCHYLNNCDYLLRLKNVIKKTDTEKFRIMADNIKIQIEECINDLHARALALENSLSDVESMKKDMLEIKRMYAEFNKRYNSLTAEVFDCCYELKNIARMKYRD